MALPLQGQGIKREPTSNALTTKSTHNPNNDCLWGEFDQNPSNENEVGPKRVSVNLTQVERDLLARLPRPLPLEGPRIHQPGSTVPPSLATNSSVQKIHPASTSVIVPCDEVQPKDPYLLGGITLLNYAAELRRVLNKIEERHAMIGNSGKGNNLPKIELPQAPAQLSNPLPTLTFTSRGPFQPFTSAAKRDDKETNNHLEPDSFHTTDTNIKIEEGTPTKTEDSNKTEFTNHKITQPVLRNVMRKSVAAISTFHGYDIAVDSALDLLTDAAAYYMQNICQVLRSNRDKQLLDSAKSGRNNNDTLVVSDQGFADVMDRTFCEVGTFKEGLKEVPEYYSQAVVGRYQAIVAQCRQLLRECHHQASLDAAYPNMASANIGNLSATGIQLPTGIGGHTSQIIAVSNPPRADAILEQPNLISDLNLASSGVGDDILGNDGTMYVTGGGSSSILGAVLSGPQSQSVHPVHPLVHPTGSSSDVRTPTGSIVGATSNNVPTFSLDHNTPQIESGLQMLQSLEQGGHFSVSGSIPQDTNMDDPDNSPAPMLSGITGASPILELHPHSISNTQSPIVIKSSPAGINSKGSTENISTGMTNSQSRKRRRTPEGQFTL